jgi:2-(1,2-epoxy-1,2-dihydrophenyl)acetyl-CoA isomerase
MSARRELHTGTEYLLGWVEDGVAVLSFNRPDRRNALHESMYFGFGEALPVIAEDPSIGCLVITGEGRAFCAGGDVKGFAEAGRSAGPDGAGAPAAGAGPRVDNLRRRQNMVTLALQQLGKITIAAIPGAAAGAGLSIALACDLRVASDDAVITTAFARIGASGDFGGSWTLTQLVGAARAKELYLLSDRLSADEAHRLGIVNRVFPADSFESSWRELAGRLAHGPVIAQRFIKENINRAANGASLAECLDAEAAAMVSSMSSADHREASIAFVEKRPPVFRGV